MGARRRIRLCHFTPCLWSGGTEERIARVMARADRQVFDLSWIGFGPVREALIERAGPGIDIHPILRDVGGGIEPALIAQLAAKLRRISPDVMHIHNWSTSLYGIASARLAGVPNVIYGLGGQDNTDPPPRRRMRAMNAMAPHVDRFTAVCGWLAEQIAANWNVPSDRIEVLRTGIDLTAIDKAPDAIVARRQLGIPEDALVVGAISVLRPVKRIPDLIDAMGIVAKKHPNAHLLLVGNPLGVSPDELREQAQRLGIGDRLHLPGRAESPPDILPAIDVFVNCSVFEGTSNAILEAMAARIPIVATAVGGTPELITNGEEGILVPPKDRQQLAAALTLLLDEPERRRRMGEAGRRRVEANHTLDTMISAYLDFYQRAGARADEARGHAMSRGLSATAESAQRMLGMFA